jgi:FixJ family two-component response regulator
MQGLPMADANPSVLIIDDDPEFRDSVGRLLRSVGLLPSFGSRFEQAARRELMSLPGLPAA